MPDRPIRFLIVDDIAENIMALEALKVLGGVGEPLLGRLWTFEALTGRSLILALQTGQ